MDSGQSRCNSFSGELFRNQELSANEYLLLNYIDPSLFIVLMNSDNNPNLTEAINGPNSDDFMVTMEKEIGTLMKMKAFVIVDKESCMNVVSSVWLVISK